MEHWCHGMSMKEPYSPNKEGAQRVMIVDRDSDVVRAIMDRLSSMGCRKNGNEQAYQIEV